MYWVVVCAIKMRVQRAKTARKRGGYMCIAGMLCMTQWLWVDYILRGRTSRPLPFIAENVSVGVLNVASRVQVPPYLYHANAYLAKDRVCKDGHMDLAIPEKVFHEYGKLNVGERPRQIVHLTMYDCELTMLELKLAEMGPVLDWIVIGELARDNSNKPRDACFAHAMRVSLVVQHFKEKIVHVYMNHTVVPVDNVFGPALTALQLTDRDLVVFTDVDQIVASQHLQSLARMRDFPEEGMRMSFRWSYYGFQWLKPVPTRVNAVVTWRRLRDACGMRANDIRLSLCGASTPGDLQGIIGWHCSWCIPTKQFIHKLETLSANELNTPLNANVDFLEDQRQRGLWFATQTPDGCYPSTRDFMVSFAPYAVIYSIPI